MQKYGEEYLYPKTEEEFISAKVRLTPKGLKRYQHSPIKRPDYINVENDIYEFKCSYDQIKEYFFHFGEEVEILEPLLLRKQAKKFYQNALNKYKED